jgi:hypothetical protein
MLLTSASKRRDALKRSAMKSPLNGQQITSLLPRGYLPRAALSPDRCSTLIDGRSKVRCRYSRRGIKAMNRNHEGMNMITRYTHAASLTAAVFSLMFLGNAAFAQEKVQEKPPTPGQADSNGAAAAISDQKIEAFVVAYRQVDKVRQEYTAKLDATPDPTAKQQLQTEASKQMVQAVQASPGMSVDEYSAILTAAQSDPTLAKKVQEKLQKSAPAQQ